MSVKYKIAALFLLVGLVFATQSCYKEKPTIAAVKLLRASDSTAISQQELRLYYTGGDRIDTIIKTNNQGYAEVNFSEKFKVGQSGFAVLDIDMVKGDSVIEPKIGVIKVEQEKKSQQTVFCTSC
jgi:hypothetical protein